MNIISLFNNKGGVGKTTLSYHLSCALAELGHKVLMIDLDPQCNLTLCAIEEERLHKIWEKEDSFIEEGFDAAKEKVGNDEFKKMIESEPRTIHFLLKPTEEGTGELQILPPVLNIQNNLDLISGRLTLHMYEYKISERWSGAYQGDPLSIRTITKIRSIALNYAEKYKYQYIIIDTSPSLGVLNKVIISTVDGFVIPCTPDMFSLYGIRNIGNALRQWQKELDTIYQLISDEKRKNFPRAFVQFLGYTIYNAKKYKGVTKWDLATAHYNYAKQIPGAIANFIPQEVRKHLTDEMLDNPIGDTAVMHSHSTLPSMSQKYKRPIWDVPSLNTLDKTDKSTISGNRRQYEATKESYISFTNDLISRLETLKE
ncbi:AAA family ATPase [bacterium]|nr:AAA family ATPase [bacterium]